MVAGPSVLLSSGDGYVGELLELPQGCQGPFRSSRGKVGFLLRCRSGKGPHLALSGESPGFSRVAAGKLGSLSSYYLDLRDTLVGPQESPVAMRVVKVLSGFLSSHCWVRGHHLKLRLETQSSTAVPTWISGFLWSFHRGVRPRLV